MVFIALLCVIFLAYSNGSNDNFKGVATLFGSRVSDYGRAIRWATVTTFLGSITALFIASGLLATFSGKGLVPDNVVAMHGYLLSVGFGAALTVFLATRLGFPISTTHALAGGLVGAGYLASPAGVNLGALGHSIFLPLIASPIMAIIAAAMLYPLFHGIRRRLGVERQSCICVGSEVVAVVPAGVSPEQAVARAASETSVMVGERPVCMQRYSGRTLGLEWGAVIDKLHYLSAGAVSFARGVNDTPKMVAILLVTAGLGARAGFGVVALAIALGGYLSARRVAETLAHRVTSMNAGQGLTANLVTAGLVIGASRYGLPVSTTHVSVGSLFGIGSVTGNAKWRMIWAIVLAWLITLPVAAVLSGLAFEMFRGVF